MSALLRKSPGPKAGLTKCPQYLIKSLISSPYSLECMVPSNPWVPPKLHCLPVKAGSEPRLMRPAHPPSSGSINHLSAPQLSWSLTTAPPPSPGPVGPYGTSHPCILHPRSPQPLSSKNTEGPFSGQARTPTSPDFGAEALGQQPLDPHRKARGPGQGPGALPGPNGNSSDSQLNQAQLLEFTDWLLPWCGRLSRQVLKVGASSFGTGEEEPQPCGWAAPWGPLQHHHEQSVAPGRSTGAEAGHSQDPQGRYPCWPGPGQRWSHPCLTGLSPTRPPTRWPRPWADLRPAGDRRHSSTASALPQGRWCC